MEINAVKKTVGDPIASYEALAATWRRNRAVMNGEIGARLADAILDVNNFTNLLTPFSPKMSPEQYKFYVAEGELPGLVGQYGKALVGGLLRKSPQFTLPPSLDTEGNRTWINNRIGAAGETLVSVLDSALWEEMQTSRAWLLVEHPQTTPDDDPADAEPFVVLIPAETVINYRNNSNKKLVKLTLRTLESDYMDGDHHPTLFDTVCDYNIINDVLVVQKYRKKSQTTEQGVNTIAQVSVGLDEWEPYGPPVIPVVRSEPMNFIPARPLNGSITPVEPMNQTLVNREIALYNKASRRNHLLYGACTYTPYISAGMSKEVFDEIVDGGLGTWMLLPENGKAGVLQPPTDALKDMSLAIDQTVAEMARMGIRMLTPDNSPQESGVALEIKNSAQLSQLGLLNSKVSKTMEIIISMMLFMKYDISFEDAQMETSFTLSEDFNPTPIGADWMRLVTEWYESRKIPRSVFLTIAKQNDIVPMDYDDDLGRAEIESDPLLMDPLGGSSGVNIEAALRSANQ